MSHFANRVKGWSAKLFWGVAGNALYSAAASGTLITGMLAFLTKLLSVQPVWTDRAVIALVTCLFIAGLTFLFSTIRSSGSAIADSSALVAGSAIARSLPAGIVIQHADAVNIIQREPNDYEATVRLHTVALHATAGAVASIEMQVFRGLPPPEARDLVVFLDALKTDKPGEEPPIKIVSNDSTLRFAELLVRSLRLLGYKLIDNPDNASYVFPARRAEQSVILRIRPRPANSGINVWKLSSLALALALGFKRLKVPCYAADFPDNDRYDYLQIELFGSL